MNDASIAEAGPYLLTRASPRANGSMDLAR